MLRRTQAELAARCPIPLGTLRDWEQQRAEPDRPARAYLKAIAGDPEGVRRALQSAAASPTPQEAIGGILPSLNQGLIR